MEQPDLPRTPAWLDLLIGLGAAVLGLLPWLLTGLRLPLQNLWETEVLPAAMPRVLLPLSQYHLLTTAGLLITGSAAAGLVVRLLRRRRVPRKIVVVLTVALLQMATLAQSAAVVGTGSEQSRRATLYLTVIIAGAALSLATGLLTTGLITARGRAPAVVGVAIAAVLFPSWLGALIVPPGSVIAAGDAWIVLVLPWVAPVLVGAAIAWSGADTVGRLAAASVALLALWIGPAAVTAIANAAGSRVLANDPAEMAVYAGEVFVAALMQPVLVLRSLAAAVAVAVVVLLLRRMARRRTSADRP